MKIGLGLYRHMLTRDYYDFARQAGCTHVVAHLVDYFNREPSNKGSFNSGSSNQALSNQGSANSASSNEPSSNPRNNQPSGSKYEAWGIAGDPNQVWTVKQLQNLRAEIEGAGLVLAAIENIDPAHWHDILLDGPQRAQQIEKVKTIIRRMGEAGIPVLGYNFSLAGVCGRVTAPLGRGGAITLGMDGPAEDVAIPNGTIWNMVYDQNAPAGTLPSISHEELWRRLERFLEEVVPVAEQAGVKLAAHPDDPPMPTMRRQPRLVYQPRMYQRLLDLVPSENNALELCVGTLAEMTEDNIYDAIESYSKQGKIAYIHLRNVAGKVPHYRETFIDEGEVDMIRVLAILHRNRFEGVVIPDHTPQVTCAAPWHAGMAHTLGFILAAKAALVGGLRFDADATVSRGQII